MTTRRFLMALGVDDRMLRVAPVDVETRAWLQSLPLDLFAELDELGRQLQRPDVPLRVDEPPIALAAKYRAQLSGLFPDEMFEVIAELGAR